MPENILLTIEEEKESTEEPSSLYGSNSKMLLETPVLQPNDSLDNLILEFDSVNDKFQNNFTELKTNNSKFYSKLRKEYKNIKNER